MSLVRSRKRNGLLPAAFPSMRSMFENWGLDDDFFDSFWNGKNVPAVNISETEATLDLELAAPGMEKDDFEVFVEDGRLVIRAEKEETEEEKKRNFRRQEYSFQSFERSFWLPDSVNEDEVVAEYKNGVLKVSLQKAPTVEVKKIEVAVN
ncbi:MAG: Hsp20/alpha crystallin family protein [Bacteroidota bacterium]